MAKKRTAKVSDLLRRAIDASPLSRYRIARETGIDDSSLAKFVAGERGLSLDSVDKLCELLGLTLQAIETTQTKGGN